VASGAGFAAIDLDLEALAPYPAADVRTTLRALGLRANACPLPVEMREDDRAFAVGFERFERLAAYAAEIGIRTMHRSIPASTNRLPADYTPLLRRRWSALAAIARAYGIVLAVEPLGPLYRRRAGRHELIWRLDDAAEFAASCGAGVGLLVDSWHWHLAGLTARDVVDVGALIVHVHIADVPAGVSAEAQRDTERALPGEGVVDLAAFLGAVSAAGYRLPVSPEVPGRWSEGMTPAAAARRALAATTGALEPV